MRYCATSEKNLKNMKTLPRNFKTELMYENYDTHQSKNQESIFFFLKGILQF